MDFEYAKVYTNKDTKLRSKTGEYLINPALVTINFIDAKDDENILKIGLKYGIGNLKSYSRDNDVENYYKMGDKVEIKPFDIEKDNKLKIYNLLDRKIVERREPAEENIYWHIFDKVQDEYEFSYKSL